MMLKNNLLDDSFVQYKCPLGYEVGDYYEKFSPKYNIGRTTTYIKALEPAIYNAFSIALEPTIQRLSNLKIPNDKEALNKLSLQLTKDYGFLYYSRHLKKLEDDVLLNDHANLHINSLDEHRANNPYEKEKAYKWIRLVETVQYALKIIDDDSYRESLKPDDRFFNDGYIDLYLGEIKPRYDFETQAISLECDSLASAIMLSIVTNKKHLKSCLQCNKLFYAKRSDAMYCNSSCGRNNQGSRRGKSKEL